MMTATMKGGKNSWDAESIRALRKHLDKTQQEMAEDLGIRQQTVSEWETGMYKPKGASSTLLNIVAEKTGFDYHVSEDS